MNRIKGFGQISLISFIALPLLLIAIGLLAKKNYDEWQEAKDRAIVLENTINEQEKTIDKMRQDFQRSQQGIARVEEQTDVVTSESKELAEGFEQIDLEKQAAEDPVGTEEFINALTKQQLDDLRNITRKDWTPNLIDNRE